MADLSKQHGLSAFGLSVSPTKKRREDSCKTEKSFLLLSGYFAPGEVSF